MLSLSSMTGAPISCLLCEDGDEAVRGIEEAVLAEASLRLVTIQLERLPRLPELLDELLRTLAEAALLVWPEWYDGRWVESPAGGVEETYWSDEAVVHRISRDRGSVDVAWLMEAVRACRRAEVPISNRFSVSLQGEQLARAIRGEDLLIAVTVPADSEESPELAGLARGLEWLARRTEARIVAVLPPGLAERPELDSITSHRLVWSSAVVPVEQKKGERKHLVCPIVGRPHPASPGEQLLAERLSTDEELRSLFQFNQRVSTTRGSRFLVDLAWFSGRVIVEVDGYGYHSSTAAFAADRQRDYELTISGFLILRLPHDEVVRDADLALEKIRDVVRFRRDSAFKEEAVA